MAKKAQEKSIDDSGKIKFFGEVDLNDEGGITSQIPAWCFDQHIGYLEEGISRKKRMLERGEVATDQVPVLRGQIKSETEKLERIVASRPNLSDKQKDRCAKAYENLGRQIADTMPTRKESKQGLVSPYDELKRLKGKKHITIDPTIASACGVKPVQGKITGDEANKCYQILGKALGENTNVERIRKDGGVQSYKTENDSLRAVLDAMFEGKMQKGL